MTRDRYKSFKDSGPCFFTCTVVNWLPILNRPEAAQIILDSLQYLQRQHEVILYAYVIMENHIHVVAALSEPAKDIGRFKSFTARNIIELLKKRGEKEILLQFKQKKAQYKNDRKYQFWQEGSHPIHIQNEEVMLQKINYIHNNPLRRGYVDFPEHWRYSSARNYAGVCGLLPVEKEW